jgi:hypothetical protein
MQEPGVNELPRWRIIRRIGAAGMALTMLLVVGACKATGGGYIGEPLPGGPVSVYNGDANFGFTFTCAMQGANKAMIGGQITYHDSATSSIVLVNGTPPTLFPEIKIHGVVDPFFVPNVSTCQQAAQAFPNGAQFDGTYCPQSQTVCVPGKAGTGRFTVQVFDQGEPARPGGDFTGDSFSIGLQGGPYNGYTRGGYIEGGNIQVYG